MAFLKNHFVNTTEEIDFIPVIHDIRFALQGSPFSEGLVTISLPSKGGCLLVSELDKVKLQESGEKFKNLEGLNIALTLPFQKKELVLDPRQMIYLVDFTNTAKRREFYIQVFGETPPPPPQPQGGRRR